MGGGKSSSQTTKVKLPKELEAGAVGALGGALQSASLPYSPNRGITIAGFSPDQQAAMNNANTGAATFGLASGAGQSYLPATQTGAGGVQGYSTGALFDQNVDASMSMQDRQLREDILQGYANTGSKILGDDFAQNRAQLPLSGGIYGNGGK